MRLPNTRQFKSAKNAARPSITLQTRQTPPTPGRLLASAPKPKRPKAGHQHLRRRPLLPAAGRGSLFDRGEIINGPDYWAAGEWLQNEPSYQDGKIEECYLDFCYYNNGERWM